MILAYQKLIWLMAIIAILIAFYKLRSGYFSYRLRAIKIMSYGCILLIFGTLVGLAGNMGIFDSN